MPLLNTNVDISGYRPWPPRLETFLLHCPTNSKLISYIVSQFAQPNLPTHVLAIATRNLIIKQGKFDLQFIISAPAYVIYRI